MFQASHRSHDGIVGGIDSFEVDAFEQIYQLVPVPAGLVQYFSNDACGGAKQVQVTSALSGEFLCHHPLTKEEEDHSFSDLIKGVASAFFGFFFYCVDVMDEATGGLVDSLATWKDLGCPANAPVVRKRPVLHLTAELFCAVEVRDLEKVRFILEAGQNPNCVLGQSILLYAAKQNDIGIVRLLLKSNAAPNFLPPGNSTLPLHIAVEEGRRDITQALLHGRANVNVKNADGATPLHFAAWLEHVDVISELVLRGGDALALDKDRDSPLVCSWEPKARAVLFDSCWSRMSPSALLTLCLPNLEKCLPKHWFLALRGVSRSMSGRGVFLRPTCYSSSEDSCGGSSGEGKGGSGWESSSAASTSSSSLFFRMHVPTFLDSELSSESSSPSTIALSPPLPRTMVLERVDRCSALCAEYAALLACQPALFASLPSPFMRILEEEWSNALQERRVAFNLLHLSSAQSVSEGSPSEDLAKRVSKRMLIYFSYCRKFVDLIQDDLASLASIPNPCDPSVTKRVWEQAACQQRQAWQQRLAALGGSRDKQYGDDALGGSANENIFLVEVKSALSSNTLFHLRVVDDVILSDVVRTAMSSQYATPWFATSVLCDGSFLAQQSWLDLMRPSEVFIVAKPLTFQFTGPLFEAISANALSEIQSFLEEGQNPNCVLADLGSALTWAIENSTSAVVGLLFAGEC